jgi:hypothetical protein
MTDYVEFKSFSKFLASLTTPVLPLEVYVNKRVVHELYLERYLTARETSKLRDVDNSGGYRPFTFNFYFPMGNQELFKNGGLLMVDASFK